MIARDVEKMTVGASAARTTGEAWPRDERERRDVLTPLRRFPGELAKWRGELCRQVASERSLFPGIGEGDSIVRVRELLDMGLGHLREINRILELVYGTPALGNKEDPVDELVYIVLARKTREEAYQRAYEALRNRFMTWDEMLEVPREEVSLLVHSSGLAGKKTDSLLGAMAALRERFGRCTLDPVKDWPNTELERFLCSLPEVSRKSAYCIMMYSLGRKVFPVDTHVGRVLARIGIYRELGLSLDGLDHKQLQAVLAPLIPPNIRYSLHVNLVTHGRAICQARTPLCQQCDIRNFCQHHRREEVRRVTNPGLPTMVDLFSGAGGLSEGFSRAGFRVLLALDQDPVALRTYSLNHPGVPEERVLCRDIREVASEELRSLLGNQKIDVLVGAPPCQGFSHAGFRSRGSSTGYRVRHDERNYLFEHLVGAAIELRPRLFLMENVPGMQSARSESTSFLEWAASLLVEAGFETQIWRLNAAAFGVPQHRVRFFLVASSTGSLPQPPQEEYQDLQRADYDLDALPPVTLGEALLGLPPLRAGQGEAISTWDTSRPPLSSRYRRYLTKFGILRESRILHNHAARRHNPRDLELYDLLLPGEDSIHAVERHGRGDLMRYRRDVFDDKYSRLRADRPCRTIVAHLAKDGNSYIHPEQVRSITVREAARVQSFHDDYIFCGTVSDQWVQVGNAVPPVLAEAIARSFLSLIERDKLKGEDA